MPNTPFWIQICFVCQIISKTNTIFQNLALPIFSVYDEISSCKKLRKSNTQILRKIRHRQTERKGDGQTNRNDFLGPFPKDGGLIMFLGNSRIKFSEIICLDCKPYGKNQYKKKEYNQSSSPFKELKKNHP